MTVKKSSTKSEGSKHEPSEVHHADVAPPAPSAPPVTPPGDLPPAPGVIATPAGWEPQPKTKKSARGQRPRGAQVTDAVSAAKELTGSSTYADDFGGHAPPAAQLGFVITNAAKWRTTWQAAKKFYAYCTEQRATWEAQALSQMDTLKPAFEYLEARDPKVAEQYPSTAKYLSAGSVISARANASRKKEKSAEVKAAKTAATAPASSSAAAKTLN